MDRQDGSYMPDRWLIVAFKVGRASLRVWQAGSECNRSSGLSSSLSVYLLPAIETLPSDNFRSQAQHHVAAIIAEESCVPVRICFHRRIYCLQSTTILALTCCDDKTRGDLGTFLAMYVITTVMICRRRHSVKFEDQGEKEQVPSIGTFTSCIAGMACVEE